MTLAVLGRLLHVLDSRYGSKDTSKVQETTACSRQQGWQQLQFVLMRLLRVLDSRYGSNDTGSVQETTACSRQQKLQNTLCYTSLLTSGVCCSTLSGGIPLSLSHFSVIDKVKDRV